MEIPFKNEGINSKINGMVTANTVERVLAVTSMENVKINKLPRYPPIIVKR